MIRWFFSGLLACSVCCFAEDKAAPNLQFPAQSSAIAPVQSEAELNEPNYEFLVKQAAEKAAAEAQQKKEAERLARLSKDSTKIFKYQKGGALTFSDSKPMHTRFEVIVYNSCYACSLSSTVDWYSTKLYLAEFNDLISNAANQYGVDAALIRAVIHAESAFNPLARSKVGAMGLMQLMPETAKDMGVSDRTNPAQNINGGVKYLAKLLERFNGNETLATAAYNAGPTAVVSNNGVPPYEETKTYVKRVKILFQRYKNQKVVATN